MKYLIKSILKSIYGVRGGLRPPLGRPFFKYSWWRLVNSLYTWSGIPEQWSDSFRDWDGPIMTIELWEKHVLQKS